MDIHTLVRGRYYVILGNLSDATTVHQGPFGLMTTGLQAVHDNAFAAFTSPHDAAQWADDAETENWRYNVWYIDMHLPVANLDRSYRAPRGIDNI